MTAGESRPLEVVSRFTGRFGERDAQGREEFGLVVVDVATRVWAEALRFARDSCGFAWFDWLTGVAAPDGGVSVVVHLWQAGARLHLVLRVPVAAGRPLPSATAVWPGAAWHERETAEMFGVEFAGFRDAQGDVVRPLLLPALADVHLSSDVPPDPDLASRRPPRLAPLNPLRKDAVVVARAARPWPGRREPGEGGPSPTPASTGSAIVPARRRGAAAPGVPDGSWGPRELTPPVVAAAAGAPDGTAEPDDAVVPGPPGPAGRSSRPRRTKRQSEGTPSQTRTSGEESGA